MRRLALLLTAAALLGAPSPAGAASCPRGARCATLTVPLDHRGATPGTLRLAYSRMPATGASRGTIALLSGGPGEPAIPYSGLFARLLAPLRADHDLVFIDQRGTGRSGGGRCRGAGSIAGCGRILGARRSLLSTAETARDLEDLRVRLGAERLTLLGVSYGTAVAVEYARRFPDRTEALVLDSAVKLDEWTGNPLPALPRVLGELCAGGGCAADPVAALNAGVARLRRGALRTRAVVTPGGRTRRVTLRERDVLRIVRARVHAPGPLPLVAGDAPARALAGEPGRAGADPLRP